MAEMVRVLQVSEFPRQVSNPQLKSEKHLGTNILETTLIITQLG